MRRAKLIAGILLVAAIAFATAYPAAYAITDEKRAEFTLEVIRLINLEREKEGIPPLQENPPLIPPAELRAEEAEVLWAHKRPPDSRSWNTVFVEFGFTEQKRGENLAYGQKTPAKVVAAWMKSPGHRKNILNERFTNVAIGLFEHKGTLYWGQLFFDNGSVEEGTISASGYGPGGMLIYPEGLPPPEASDEGDDVPQPDEGAVQYALVDNGIRLNLRAEPSGKSKSLAVLEEGTRMKVLDILDGWVEVELDDGTRGWASQKYVVIQ